MANKRDEIKKLSPFTIDCGKDADILDVLVPDTGEGKGNATKINVGMILLGGEGSAYNFYAETEDEETFETDDLLEAVLFLMREHKRDVTENQ